MTKAVISSVFESVAELRGNAPAVRSPGGELTYAGLNEAANRLAHHLRARCGIGRGSVVGLGLPMGLHYLIALLGVAKAGGVFLPLDPALPALRLEQFLARARPALVVTDRAHASAWPPTHAGAGPLILEQMPAVSADPVPLEVTGDDPAYIVFTSGSTGEPKAILGTHKGLSHFIHWEVKEFALDASARISQFAPPTFDVSLRDIFAPLIAGGVLCIPPDEARTHGSLLVDWLEAEAITLMHGVPSLFREVIRELADRPPSERRLTRLRSILLAGEPLYGVDVQRWRALMGDATELVNLYGPSETTLAKAFHRIRETPPDPARMIPVGQPLPGAALLIIKDGELCDRGEIGEVYIKTPFMSRGYYGDPALTDEAFVQNPLTPGVPDRIYRSGDIGRYLADRSVELLGRQDGQVKVNGVRIEVAEIEQTLLRHPAIAQAVVVAHPTPAQQPCLTAYFIASEPLADADLRRFLGDWLPASMHPAFFVQMERFPLNLHGKVTRRALPRPADLLYLTAPCVEPEGEDETVLAALWDEVLGLRKIGVTHRFVELGGDSLKAVRLLSRIYQRFGVQVKLPELFPQATVRDLARLIAARRETEPAVAPGLPVAAATAEELAMLAE